MGILNEADKKILPLALRGSQGFHLATKWYLRGWTPLPYQWAWHQLEVMNTTICAGIATGKTSVVAASYLVDCLSIPYFRALNTSVTAKQAELAFDMILAWIEGNDHLAHLVDSYSLRPFPILKLKNFSEFEFRTAGVDARFIRGSEYDRINFDECGLDPNGTIIKVLRGRLRGRRPDGTVRMARLDATTSPTDAIWLRERFERGWSGSGTEDLRQYRSLRWATWHNTMLTPEQVEAMVADYPPEMIDVELGGMFPDYGMSMFPSGHINACIDPLLYDLAYLAANPESGKAVPGYALDEDPRHGIIHYETPVRPGRIYISGGDPGTDNYPKRNAPVVMAADVTEKPYELVYFWWGSGKGSYKPFLQAYRYVVDKYDPVLKGVDATGPQKALDELGFESVGIKTDRLNFGSDKAAMLNALSMDITNHHWRVPPVKGLKRQAGIYTLEDDKKIPQDIVMAWAELSHLARFVPEARSLSERPKGANYRDRRLRTTAARRRR